MFVAAFSLMADPTKAGEVESKAEILITVRWGGRPPGRR